MFFGTQQKNKVTENNHMPYTEVNYLIELQFHAVSSSSEFPNCCKPVYFTL
jgi:hypothetical protein